MGETANVTVMTVIRFPRSFHESLDDDMRRSFLDETEDESSSAEEKAALYLEERGQKAVDPICAALAAEEIECDIRFVDGDDPAEAIIQTAGKVDAEMVIMGATRRLFTEEAWRSFIDSNNPPGTWDALAEDAKAKLLPRTDAIASCYHANLNHGTTLAECRAIALPTLLLYGGSAFPRMRKITEIIAGEITGSRLESIPGAGHMSPLTHPEMVADKIANHLTG